MSYKQERHRFELKTPLGKDVLIFRGLHGGEGISRLFSFAVEAVAENKTKIPFDQLLGQKCTVKMLMGRDESPTYLNGFCRAVWQGMRDMEFTRYRLELVPEFWRFTRQTRSRIFQQMAVPDILRKVLKGLDVSWQLTGTYKPRDYTVQYRESDFVFACRLMEEEGVFYFFKHSDGSHQMLVGDDRSVHPDVPGPSSIPYEELEGGDRDEERIWAWNKGQELRSGKTTLWDHCFELPHKHLEAEEPVLGSVPVGTVTHKLKVGGNDAWELYDWRGEYAKRFDGIEPGGGERPADIQNVFEDNRRTTKIRMDQETTPSIVVEAQTNTRHLRSGHRLSLKGHPHGDGAYVVLSNEVSAEVGNVYRSGTQEVRYRASIQLLPAELPFRPARTTPKAIVHGCQTAVVVGPPGEEIFVDKYSRVKVQFHWDREGKNNQDSSCWIRVGTIWAGKQWGAIHIPRIGQEVLVDFMDGDPDQPIIVGSVYNADMMPPYKLPDNKTQSGLQSRSTLRGTDKNYNELRFEDKKGEEDILFHAEKDFHREVENDDDLIVGHDQTIVVKHDRMEQVEGKEEVLVCGNRDHDVEGNDGLWVAGSDGRGVTIENGDHNLLIKMGNQWTELTMGNQDTKLGMGNQKTTLDLGNITTTATFGKMEFEALQSIELKVGMNSIKIDQTGVTIKGMMVTVEGQVNTSVKGLMTTVNGTAMLTLKGGITMIG